ncbi:MAG: response regulator [Magnetospirillum gryphiswaldense]|nr:response regulator [Magnetospirillum gryphiswaldense]
MSTGSKLERFSADDVTVLVVEDDASTRSLLMRMLKTMGAARIYEAVNGGEGLRLACEMKPHVAICDVNMEPVDGLSFLGGVRAALNPKVSSLPVVMFTAAKDSAAMEKARALGVQGYLLKPFNPKGFASTMCDIVAKTYKADWGSVGAISPPPATE